MKHFRKSMLSLMMCLILLLSAALTVSAADPGEGNIDGGGGGMGQGTKENVWHLKDGVRVTVITRDGEIVSTPFDLTNCSLPDNLINFGQVCKLSYANGAELSPTTSYTCTKPGEKLPRIVSAGSSSSERIEEIRKYFCSEYAAQLVSDKTGIAFEDLVSGTYKLFLEPIAYFTHNSQEYAMTATEAALYDIKSNKHALLYTMPSLTHKNLPLAMFLEEPDIGYPAWDGATDDKVSNDDIIAALGMAIVSYRDVPEDCLEAQDYTYRTDTDVISSVTLTTDKEINPDEPASVTFRINGRDYKVTNIVIPKGCSQTVWVKWHTPVDPATLTITVTASGAKTGKTQFQANIVSPTENPPPDPKATDTNPRFTVPSLPPDSSKRTASWSVWSAEWKTGWTWASDWQWKQDACTTSCLPGCTKKHGQWVDNGKWCRTSGMYVFSCKNYSATLTGSMDISPDDTVPTASGNTMKSGYGIKESVTTALSTNAPSSSYTPSQTAYSYFPEFAYDTYWRLLSCTPGTRSRYSFKPNSYSTTDRKVHFTPVWYPDNKKYTVYTHVIDAWTPSGMLSISLSDYVQIKGSLYDDWYSARE